ncbi:MAG: rhodanese-like domain-containing protein [Rhodospirillaceae bacterium]|nr:rhodanese-like domain-containing protein [Rhodospirillaceae bacterium]
MESSFFDNFDPMYVIGAVFILGTLVMVKFLPRLTAGVPFIEPKSIYDLIDTGMNVVVLDVRSEGEFTGELGHVPGSVNLAGMELDKRLAAVGSEIYDLKDAPIFITCRTNNRSPRAARILTKAGFTNVAIVKGGMVAWNKQGLPIEK